MQVVAFFLTFVGAALLASTQLRRGRGDRRGALRVGIAVFAVLMVFWCLVISRLPHDASGLVWTCQRAVGMATWIGLMYFGIEPYVRRRWPRLMVSWSRVLGGRWRDPLVGRDILIGLAVGLGVPVFLNAAEVLVRSAFDMPGPFPAWYAIPQYGARQAVGLLFMNAIESLNGAFCTLVAPLVVMLVLRKFSVSLGVLWLFASYMMWKGPWVASLAIAAVLAAAVFFVTFRYGLLASVFAHFAMLNVLAFPGTTDFLAWNGRPAAIALTVMICLAGYGLITALAGRRRGSKRALIPASERPLRR